LVDDAANFSSPNYIYYTFNASNTTYQIDAPISNGTWYWRVAAYDKASNNINSTKDFIYIIDILSPAEFDLDLPGQELFLEAEYFASA